MNVPFLQTATFTGLVSTDEYRTSLEWNEAYDLATGLVDLSSNWQETYTTVQTNSAQWASNIDLGVRALSGNWQGTYTNVQSNSGNWNYAYNVSTFYSQNSSILIEQTTFTQLTSLKANNQLKPGQFYQINDFELKWKGQGFYDPEPFKSSGVIEPLLVLALSSNKLDTQAYSVLHPSDIVYYNIDAVTSTGWGSFPGPGPSVPGIKGWITRRIDRVRNIDIGWDWRYIKNNCCKYNFSAIPVWSSSTTYNFKDFVQSPAGKLYYSIQDNNTNRPLTDISWWSQYSDAISEVNTFYPSGEIDTFVPLQTIKLTSIFPYTITPILSTRTQLPTFPNANGIDLQNIKIRSGYNNLFLSNVVRDCTIESDFYFNIIAGGVGFGAGFEKNEIKNTFRNNNIGYSFISNTIADNFSGNTTNGYRSGIYPTGLENCTIKNGCTNNHFGIDFAFNFIGNSCSSNIFGRRNRNNTFANNLQNNIILQFCENNIILDSCQNNLIKSGFLYNKIDNTFQNNTIESTCSYNVFGNNCINNSIGTFCSYNNISNEFSFNTIGIEFQSNTIKDYFTNNTIGNNFIFNNISNGFQNNTTSSNFSYVTTNNNINSINFSSATHVYNTYDKTIFNNANSVKRLSFFNSNDQLVVTDPTA